MSEKDEKLNKGSFLYINDEEKAEWGWPEGYPSKSVQTTTLMEEREFAFSDEGGAYVAHTNEAFEITEGRVYTVNWDGTDYECVCSIYNEIPFLGNTYIQGEGQDTKEPFLYIFEGNNFASLFTLDTSASHTISVKITEGTVIPMASAFLPQATQTTYGAIKKAAAVANVTAAPTAEEFNALLKSLRDAGILATS